MTDNLDELQRMPQETAAEEDTPCIPRAAAQVPTFTTVC